MFSPIGSVWSVSIDLKWWHPAAPLIGFIGTIVAWNVYQPTSNHIRDQSRQQSQKAHGKKKPQLCPVSHLPVIKMRRVSDLEYDPRSADASITSHSLGKRRKKKKKGIQFSWEVTVLPPWKKQRKALFFFSLSLFPCILFVHFSTR